MPKLTHDTYKEVNETNNFPLRVIIDAINMTRCFTLPTKFGAKLTCVLQGKMHALGFRHFFTEQRHKTKLLSRYG